MVKTYAGILHIYILFYNFKSVTKANQTVLIKVKGYLKGGNILEDEEIVTLFLKRDELALRYASEKYGKRLRLLSQGIVNDMQTAEECENDTYVQG